MATKLFLRDSASDLTIGAATNKGLLLQQGAAKVASDATATATGPTAGLQVKKSSVVLTWFSNPLKALTISGTITFNLWGLESATQANTGFDVLVERCDQNGNVLSTIARSERGTELGTSAAVQNWTTAPTSTALSEGDRVKVTVFGNDAGGTMASGRTFTLDYGAGTGVDGDSYVQFNETISEGARAAETSPGADAASVSATLTVAETGAGSDTASASPELTPGETTPGSDQLALAALIAATESGAGTDSSIVSAELPAAEIAPGTDQANLAVEIVLSETGAGSDALDVLDNGSEDQDLEAGDSGAGTDTAAASADVAVGETSTGSELLSVTAEITANESAAGQDLVSASAEINSSETAPGSDQLTLIAAMTTDENGAGEDSVSTSAEIVLAEGAPGFDDVIAAEEGNPSLTESGPGADDLGIIVEIPIGEDAPGSDALFVTVSIDLSEAAPGSDETGQEDAPTGSEVGESGAGTDSVDATTEHSLNEEAPGRDRCFATWIKPFWGTRPLPPRN